MSSRQSITYVLLCLGIILTSFCLEIAFYPFFQDTILDYRTTKATIALIFSAAILCWALCGQHRIECKNPWLSGLVFYLVIHPLFSPKISTVIMGKEVGSIWEYQAIVTVLLYFGVFCVISNLRWSSNFIEGFFKVLMWCGSITAVYALLQYFNLDQFQHIIKADYSLNTHGGKMSATFTHPNYSGSFIALMIPFAIYFKRWWHVILMLIAVILITSKMSMLVAVIGISVFCIYRWRGLALSILGIIFGFCIFLSQTVYAHLSFSDVDSGRSAVWIATIHDCVTPWIADKAFPILGHGLNFYKTIWANMHPGMMVEAHNEWLQLWMDAGLVADGLLIFSIFWLIKRLNIYRLTDDQTVALLACFMGSLGGSCGLFIWQIEPHRLLTVVIFALLHRKLTTEELK